MKPYRSRAKEERAFTKVKRVSVPKQPKVAVPKEEEFPLKLAGGQSQIPQGFTSFWPGGGRWEGPSRVAAGSNILGGQPWQYYDINNPQAPWIGLEGPRGTLGQWVDVPGQERRGRVIDVKGKGYGGYGVLQRAQYNRKGNPIPGTVGYQGGGGGLVGGGPFEGWTPQAAQEWHSGTGISQLGYPSFSGATAGPGGQQLAYNTTSYQVPGYGWVPQAQLANAQASLNPLDYLNPFGNTTQGGSGTGVPTQKAVGTAVGTLSNLIVPGLGFLTGPLARMVTKMIQGGASPSQVKAVVAKEQQKAGVPMLPQPGPQPQMGPGGGYSPTGQAAVGREYWSNDFGRGLVDQYGQGPGNYNLAGPGGGFGQKGTGFGSGTVGNWSTAIGFGGSYGGAGLNTGASRYIGGSGFRRPYTQEQYNAGPLKYPAPTLSNAFGGVTQRPSYEEYLSGWHAPGTVGSSTGPGGAAYGGAGGVGGKQSGPSPWVQKKAYKEGESDVMALERGNYPVTEEELRGVPDWLRDMLRTIPVQHGKGRQSEQFSPQSVPVMQGPQGRFYDPRYSREDERIMAKKGKTSLPDTDTVPAMLTPREAVLNRNAAELAGRGNIEKLNAEGNKLAEKGVDLASGDKNMKTKKYQGGTDNTGYGAYPAKAKNLQDQMPPEQVPGLGGGFGPRDQYGRQFSARDQSGRFPGYAPPVAGPGTGPFTEPPGGGWSPQPQPVSMPPMSGAFPGRGPGGVYPGGGGFYPKGQGVFGMQAGTTDVIEPIGTPPVGQQAYGPPVQLTAGDVSKFQKAAQQAGLNQSQISGIMQALKGLGGAGAGGGAGSYFDTSGGAMAAAQGQLAGYQGGTDDLPDMMQALPSDKKDRERLLEVYKASTTFGIPELLRRLAPYLGGGNEPGMAEMAPRYQGGISDIGYPPFIAPQAEFHGDRGGWLGTYNPDFMVPRYSRGTASVSRFW